MGEASTPRQMVKALLQGATPSRPLLVPVIFSLGARLQNLPLSHFLANPTKIVNALRQIHSALKVDGIACYFDPFLEAVALGCKREWRADGTCAIASASCLSVDDLRERLKQGDDLSGAGHIPVACEVLRRLKTMLKDEPALMVRVSGPFSLAAMLSGDWIRDASPPRDLIEFAAQAITSVAKSFAEAGADIIFLSEDFVPDMSSEAHDWYGSLLAPIANVIRFYEALPVVSWGTTPPENLAALVGFGRDCALCPLLPAEMLARGSLSHSTQSATTVSVSAKSFYDDPENLRTLPAGFPNLGLLTSAADIPANVDIKHLARGLDAIRTCFGLSLPVHETLADPT
jgi:Uroporphyrinogen decarboxylase (URO-D)